MRRSLAKLMEKQKASSVQLTCYLADYTGELAPDAEIEELKFVDGNDGAIMFIGCSCCAC